MVHWLMQSIVFSFQGVTCRSQLEQLFGRRYLKTKPLARDRWTAEFLTWMSRSRQMIVNGLSCHSFWLYIRCKLSRTAWRTSDALLWKYSSTLFNSASKERRKAGWGTLPVGSRKGVFSSFVGWSEQMERQREIEIRVKSYGSWWVLDYLLVRMRNSSMNGAARVSEQRTYEEVIWRKQISIKCVDMDRLEWEKAILFSFLLPSLR